jgi:hypothetical protein
MKNVIILFLVAFNPVFVLAQKQNLFADVGTSSGFSVTYVRKLTKRIGVGAGLQGYDFRPTITNKKELVPALYVDVRLNSVMRKKHFFFYFLDLGLDLYKANDDNTYRALFDYVPRNNGLYSGLGIGYFRSVTKRGWGPYASLKLLTNWYNDNAYDIVANRQHDLLSLDGTIALSVGFKF